MTRFLLNHQALRALDKGDLAKYLRSEQRRHPEDPITTELFDEVERESLPPDVAALWIRIAQTPTPTVKGLQQDYSSHLRKAAIVRFGRWLKKPQWMIVWDQLGGADGILQLFARLPVSDIKQLCTTIGRIGNTVRSHERERAIEQLIRGLLISVFPSASPQSSDRRPLDTKYIKLAPACSSDFVEDLLERQTHLRDSELPIKHFVRNFAPMFQQFALDGLFTDRASRYDPWEYLPVLLEKEPPLPGEEDGFSASMTFCMKVLYRLASHHKRSFPLERFFSTIAEPFLRRAIRRKLRGDRLKEALQLMLTYIQNDPQAAHTSSGGNIAFILLVSKCWSRYPEALEAELITSLELLKSVLHLDSFVKLAHDIYKERRYRLFELYCLHKPELQIDIEDHQQIRRLGNWYWNKKLFYILPGDHGLQLLQRLIEQRPEADFIEYTNVRGICSQRVDQSSKYTDPEIVLAHLQYTLHGPQLLSKAKDQLEKRKVKALRSREQTDRAFWAKSALLYSIATGSLELYHSTLIWSQRYVRDALTLRTLFGVDVAGTLEGIRLLALPETKGRETTAEGVRSHVVKGNEILLTFLETACLALREPSFQTYDWQASLNLFGNVVNARIKNIYWIKHAAKLSEAEIEEYVWKPTLDTLLRAEKIGTYDGHEKLNFRNPAGPLLSRGLPSRYLPSVYRFLDNLAIERDKMWREFRPRMFPIVASLPPPWPRGLPIQYLLRDFDVADEASTGNMPFIASRAADIVHLDPRLALCHPPEDEDTRRAIGCFVDSYVLALKIHVQQQISYNEQRARLHSTWIYTMKALTGQRMNDREALRFWRAVFVRALPRFALELPTEPVDPSYPVLPSDADSGMNTEWDPGYGEPDKEESRTMQPTVLDCFLDAGGFYGNIDSLLNLPSPRVAGRFRPIIWFVNKTRRVQEGIVVSAILYLDAKRRSAEDGPRLLITPFPSLSDVRYPPLFLDSDFLLRPGLHEMDAVMALESREIMDNVPPSLLEELTRHMLDKLTATKFDDPQISSLERVTYGLLRVLCAGDRPLLACELVMRTILERPDASSWHRQLLTRTFLRRISPKAAKGSLMNFASGVQERLRLSKEKKEGAPEDPKAAKPFVKVTTIKYLAQMLGDADFISTQEALHVLTDLLQNVSHIDIRVAVIDTLLARIPRDADAAASEMVRQMFASFESLVPVIGGISERYQLTEEDWSKANNSNEPPEISDETTAGLTPLLMAFVSYATSYGQPDWVRREMIDRVLLPAVRASVTINERWLRVFLRGHNLTPEDLCLPPTPVRPLLLDRLLSSLALSYVPADIFKIQHQITMTNMRPSSRLREFLKNLNSNPVLLASNSGKHFISLFGQGDSAYSKGGHSFAQLLTRPQDPDIRPSVGLDGIQGYLLEQAAALLELEDPNFSTWDTWIRQFQPTLSKHTDAAANAIWQKNVKPLLEKIIETLSDKRNDPSWKDNPNRKPCVLPQTLTQSTWLLPYPSFQLDERSLEEQCRLFVARVLDVLGEIASRGLGVGMEDAQILADAVLKVPTVEEKVLIAYVMGDVEAGPINGLQLMMAEKLVKGLRRRELSHDFKRRLREMTQAWKMSSDERVRIRGFRVEKEIGPEN